MLIKTHGWSDDWQPPDGCKCVVTLTHRDLRGGNSGPIMLQSPVMGHTQPAMCLKRAWLAPLLYSRQPFLNLIQHSPVNHDQAQRHTDDVMRS